MDNQIARRREDGEQSKPRVSVVIATRDRGSAILATLVSVRASTLRNWELVVVDQSASDDTEAVVRPIADADVRIQYVRSSTTGLSTGTNVGLRMTNAPYVAITDDDCEVAPDWLERTIEAFEAEPTVGFICGAFIPAPFDPRAGHTPQYLPDARRIVMRPWPLTTCFGGNMAVRRSVLDEVGFFDELLGPGAVFSCTGDQDLCHRVLLAGYRVLIAPEVRVIHHGFRTNAQMRPIWERDARGIGGMLAKELRCGAPQALLELTRFWAYWISITAGHTLTFRRPFKFRQTRAYVLYSALSFIEGLRYPLNRDHRVYLPQTWLSADTVATPSPQLATEIPNR